MTIQTFIEKAIEGGWDNRYMWFTMEEKPQIVGATVHDVAAMLLDPLAWKAVGKAEAWPEYGCRVHSDEEKDWCGIIQTRVWLNKMHRMIDHLAEGGSIESYIETL